MFDWDETNAAHIAEHGVSRAEAEEVITNNPFDMSYEVRNGEERFRQVGETLAGRILVVIGTERRGITRVITAYPPSRFLLTTYLQHRVENANAKENSS